MGSASTFIVFDPHILGSRCPEAHTFFYDDDALPAVQISNDVNIFISPNYIHNSGGERVLCVLWFKWVPESTSKLLELWKEFKYPEEVKLIARYLLIGRHISVAIFDAPNEEAILKITYPFREIGVPHIAPALPLEEALEIMEKM